MYGLWANTSPKIHTLIHVNYPLNRIQKTKRKSITTLITCVFPSGGKLFWAGSKGHRGVLDEPEAVD